MERRKSKVVPQLVRRQELRQNAGMDSSSIEDLIASTKPFRIETASGTVFEIPHRDFVSFLRKKTALVVSYEETGEDHIAIAPLLTVTSTMTKA